MQLDPYDVLGVRHNASLSDIKRAYKNMLRQTHPDKMGDARCFMMVHRAFADIQKLMSHKETNAPQTNVIYSHTNDDIQPTKMNDFSNDKFNKYFDKHRINDTNPYAREGYQQMMGERVSYQEDVDVLRRQQVHIPTQHVVVYKEPESLLSSPMLESCFHLGQEHVADFSGCGGTDIMKAFCHTEGNPIDTCKRYSSVDQLQNERAQQNLNISDHERRQMQKRDARKERLEHYRMRTVHSHDENIQNMYRTLHNRLR